MGNGPVGGDQDEIFSYSDLEGEGLSGGWFPSKFSARPNPGI